MGVWDFLRSIAIDEYKYGAERQSERPIVYVDVDKVDISGHQRELKEFVDTTQEVKTFLRKNFKEPDLKSEEQMASLPPELRKNFEKGLNVVADLVRPQIEEFHPGITSNVPDLELAAVFVASISDGPFADRYTLQNHGICLINEAKGDELNPEKLIKTGLFGFAKDGGFNPNHFRELPGSKEAWDQLIGEHEGAHCNQENKEGLTLEERDLQTLDHETLSDLAALKSMREAGHHDVAQAWVDIRILATVQGDHTHASSMFIEEGVEYTGVSQKHMTAIKDLKEEMDHAVSKELGLNLEDAENLRKSDPQRYANALEEKLKSGDFPTSHQAYDSNIEDRIMKKMGVNMDEYYGLPTERLPEVFKAYKELETKGELQKKVESPDLVKKMAEQYVGATRRLFVEDTSPTTPAATPAIDKTDIAQKTMDERLRESAEEEVYVTMDENVAKRLGISVDDAGSLFVDNPQKYVDTLEEMIKDGSFVANTPMELTEEEKKAKFAKLFDVDPDKVKDIPNDLKLKAERYLTEIGENRISRPNPYVLDQVKKEIKDMKESLLPDPEAKSENEASAKKSEFSANAAECTAQKSGDAQPSPQNSADCSAFRENADQTTQPAETAAPKTPAQDATLPDQQVNTPTRPVVSQTAMVAI